MLTRTALPLVLSVAAVIAGQGAPVPPQAAAIAQGAILGRVVDAGSGAGVAGAVIAIAIAPPAGQPPGSPPGAPRPSVITDADGRFVISGLPSGRIDLTTVARGYLQHRYGALRPGGAPQPIELAAGQRLPNVVIPIWKETVLTGRVLDDAGDPMEGVSIGILRRETIGGRLRYTTGSAAMSDDRGMFRAPALIPGQYMMVIAASVSTTPRGFLDLVKSARAGSQSDQAAFERSVAGTNLPFLPDSDFGFRVGDLYVTSASGFQNLTPDGNGSFTVVDARFYQDAATPDSATVLTIAAGETRRGVDLRLRLAPTTSISGMVTRSDGGSVANIGIRLALESLGQLGTFLALEAGTSITDAQGRFTLLGVPRGSFLIRARVVPVAESPAVDPGPVLSAVIPVSVGDTPVRGVTVALTEAPRLSGRVEFEGAPAPTAAQLARLAMEVQTVDVRYPNDPPAPRGLVAANGEFATPGITPGAYVLRSAGLPGWTIKSAIAAGKDISDEPFNPTSDIRGVVVTLTNQVSTLTGMVTRIEGGADPEAAVLAFPADRTRPGVRRRQLARVDKKGAYSMAGLPAGEYLLIAINDRISANWEDPPFLAAAAQLATRVTVPVTGSIAMDLRTADIRREQR